MKETSTKLPPVYQMDRVEVLAFALGWSLFALFLVFFILYADGTGFIIFWVGIAFAYHYWPTIPARIRAASELHRFKKEIDEHRNVKD